MVGRISGGGCGVGGVLLVVFCASDMWTSSSKGGRFEARCMSEDVAALAWERRGREVVYECPGFEVVHEEVVLPDGSEAVFDYVSEPAAVVVVPFVDAEPGGDGSVGEAEVVVIEEWRQAVERVNRGLPAGSTEPDDDELGVAARRELREETGFEAGAVERVCVVEPANGLLDSVHHVFVATGCERVGEQELDHNESIRVATTTFGELLESVREGSVRDGRTHVAVLRYALDRMLDGAPDVDLGVAGGGSA